ncbi:MAG: sigma-70 family RNA polymerase sigma factor [Myxococcales bacterium]|nr:sigma-70 family RNA polymerase sigma factor [Myxococcales bacterium]
MPDDSLEVDALCRVARGDREALACLYDAHGEVVYGMLMTILRQPSEAQDLLHDVFVEVLERAGDYDPRRGSVRGWLLMRARSRALDRVRSARVRRERLTNGDDPERTHPAPGPDTQLDDARLRHRLGQLDEGPRAVLELAYFRGLSTREIAVLLDIPQGTVKSRAAAGLRALRSELHGGDA